jgi:hypothetical protein
MTSPTVAGTPVSGGTFVVAEYERVISHGALDAPPIVAPLLHPVWTILGALRGMGTDLSEVFALADATEDGTLFGEVEFEQRAALRAGVEYAVRGAITDLVRREGRRAGPFDILSLKLEIVDPTGEVAAAVTQFFVIPRGRPPDA